MRCHWPALEMSQRRRWRRRPRVAVVLAICGYFFPSFSSRSLGYKWGKAVKMCTIAIWPTCECVYGWSCLLSVLFATLPYCKEAARWGAARKTRPKGYRRCNGRTQPDLERKRIRISVVRKISPVAKNECSVLFDHRPLTVSALQPTQLHYETVTLSMFNGCKSMLMARGDLASNISHRCFYHNRQWRTTRLNNNNPSATR